ncbi:MAG: hypothetical protein K0S79_1933 [Nitrospira sp.]|jgi:hypothetical protein|nr:hypothetical protein [Nitrospira sp.]
MRGRYKKRVQYEALVNFSNSDLTGQGRVIDITAPGCQIESTQRVVRGQYLELRLSLPGGASPFTVTLAAVRWTKGNRFGVEFIKMGKCDQEILEEFMAEHVHD